MVLGDENYVTIKEITTALGLTTDAVRKRIKKLGVKPDYTDQYKKEYFSKQSFLAIRNNLLFKKVDSNPNVIYITQTFYIIPSKLNFMF